jgi:hypothetical protein
MMFASELHIPPWDVGRLTVGQVHAAVEHFDALIAEAEKARTS